jgi:glutaredoxin
MNRKLLMATLGILTISVIVLSGCDTKPPQPSEYTALAKCLTSKGVIFYGAYWCPHCQDQKKMFGDAMQYVKYVECDPKGPNAQPEECLNAKVEHYPTWFFPGQGSIEGARPLEELASKANCEESLPRAVTSSQQTSQNTQTATASTQQTAPLTQTQK